jgi:hypothetical protein
MEMLDPPVRQRAGGATWTADFLGGEVLGSVERHQETASKRPMGLEFPASV